MSTTRCDGIVGRVQTKQWVARARVEAMSGPLGLGTRDDAYAGHRELIRRGIGGARGPVAGYKIALTSKAVQELCGVDHPCAGAVFGSSVLDGPATVQRADFVRLGLEFEVCLRLEIGRAHV